MLGRRLGRIYGQLDDIATLLEVYRAEQAANHNNHLSVPLALAQDSALRALNYVQEAIDKANRGAK